METTIDVKPTTNIWFYLAYTDRSTNTNVLFRNQEHVPRVGDTIEIHLDSEYHFGTVTRVVWQYRRQGYNLEQVVLVFVDCNAEEDAHD